MDKTGISEICLRCQEAVWGKKTCNVIIASQRQGDKKGNEERRYKQKNVGLPFWERGKGKELFCQENMAYIFAVKFWGKKIKAEMPPGGLRVAAHALTGAIYGACEPLAGSQAV